MKQFIAAMIAVFFIATVAQAQTAVTKSTTTQQTEKSDVKAVKKTCCGHDFIDANNDGFCDKCGMKMEGTQSATSKSGCAGSSKAAGCSKSCAKTCGGMNKAEGTKPKEETKPSGNKK